MIICRTCGESTDQHDDARCRSLMDDGSGGARETAAAGLAGYPLAARLERIEAQLARIEAQLAQLVPYGGLSRR